MYGITLPLIFCLLSPPSRFFPEHPQHYTRFGLSRAVDGGGNVYLVTVGCDPNAQHSYVVGKYDNVGRKLWQRFGPGVVGPTTSFASVLPDRTGNARAVFTTHIALADGILLGCATNEYGRDGQELWAGSAGAGELEMLDPVCGVLDNGGNLCVIGSGGSPGAILKEDESMYFDDACGLKAKTRSGRQKRRSEDIETYWLHRSSYDTSEHEVITVKYDPNGHKLWMARYGRRWKWSYWPIDAKVDAKGDLYVVGRAEGPGTSRLLVIKYNAHGNRIWDTQYDEAGQGYYYPEGSTMGAAGHLYVVGGVQIDRGARDLFICRYDPQGKQEWMTTYREEGKDYVSPASVAVDPEGDLYVTALVCISPWKGEALEKADPVQGVFATLKYDSAGNRVWAAKDPWPIGDRMWVYELVVDQRGHLHALAFSNSGSTVIEYDKKGRRQSVRQLTDVAQLVRFLSILKQRGAE